MNLLMLKLNSVMVSYFNEEFILHQLYFRNHSILIKIQIIVVRRVEYKKDNINIRLVLRFTELANKQKCNMNGNVYSVVQRSAERMLLHIHFVTLLMLWQTVGVR